MFLRYLKADFLKTRHLSIRNAHIFIPILTAFIFSAYYSYAPWDDYVKVNVYYQVLGMALPFLIGVFCAILAEQEQTSGYFQVMLMSTSKVIPFLSKLIMLLIFCAGSLLSASLIFGIIFQFGLHGQIIDTQFHLFAALIMLMSSIPLYLLHLVISFQFNNGVSIAFGIFESVLSALFLTGLGDSTWKYVPSVWPARMVTTFLEAYTGETIAYVELQKTIFIVFFVIIVGMIVYSRWACRWEGTKIAD